MADVVQIWKEVLPTIIQQVTGRGVWAALNAAKPILIEDNTVVLGISADDGELAGHLRIPSTKRLIEIGISKVRKEPTVVRIIDGTTLADYDIVKRRDAERRRLQEVEMTKMRAEMSAKNSWDTVYEQLSRRFAAVTNRSLPQNRARFYEEAVSLIAEARQSQAEWDDMGERNFARCLERLAQFVEMPSALVATHVLQRAGEI